MKTAEGEWTYVPTNEEAQTFARAKENNERRWERVSRRKTVEPLTPNSAFVRIWTEPAEDVRDIVCHNSNHPRAYQRRATKIMASQWDFGKREVIEREICPLCAGEALLRGAAHMVGPIDYRRADGAESNTLRWLEELWSQVREYRREALKAVAGKA